MFFYGNDYEHTICALISNYTRVSNVRLEGMIGARKLLVRSPILIVFYEL